LQEKAHHFPVLEGNRIDVFAVELEADGFGATSGAARGSTWRYIDPARAADLAIGSCIREALRPP
jgi:hypothetical protein